ncbi:DNA-binding protein, partial [Pseudomonas sp. FW305-130]
LQEWVDAAAKASTSDPGKAVVLPARRHSPAELEQARHPRR